MDKQESLELLQRIDGRLARIEQRAPRARRKAVAYGAVAGALAGGLVACGLKLARIKLGV